MRTQKFRKTKLSLALTSALAGGLVASGQAQAVYLDNNDRLGDAGIFQYYTAQAGWQTLFRIINTSDDVVSVKLRFHEAANSREVLDFILLLSPYDMWSAWTSANALGNGKPGLRTNDNSCLVPWVGDGINVGEGWLWVNEATGLKGVEFQSRAFTGNYDDNASKSTEERLSEGWLEVIGIAKHAHSAVGNFWQDVNQHTDASCDEAAELFYTTDTFDYDLGPVLGFNGYLINVNAGQGGGYDPDVLADFASDSLVWQARKTDTQPNLDSGNTDRFAYGYGYDKVAINQFDKNGEQVTAGAVVIDINGNGLVSDINVPFDINGDNVCEEGEVVNEFNAPYSAFGKAIANISIVPGEVCYAAGGAGTDYPPLNIAFSATNSGPIWYPLQYVDHANANAPGRIAQRGVWGDAPVRGSVDAVSWELQRDSVINEWAASYNPNNVVSDYFTQWVLTFPTKNFYVDLQDDPEEGDYSPTLKDTVSDYAFAPFIEKFPENGESCVPFAMDMWERDEEHSAFTSPSPEFPQELCYEMNVVNFDGNSEQDYATMGLASNFGITIPYGLLPPNGQRGWAQMTFLNEAGLLKLPSYSHFSAEAAEAADSTKGKGGGWPEYFKVRYGLPVTGFLFSVYNTNSSANNHAAINAHKYTRQNGCYKVGYLGDNEVPTFADADYGQCDDN